MSDKRLCPVCGNEIKTDKSICEMCYNGLETPPELPKGYRKIKTGKCPFRKIIGKIHITEDGIHQEEKFANCIGFDCMAFSYQKIENIESIECKRLEINGRI